MHTIARQLLLPLTLVSLALGVGCGDDDTSASANSGDADVGVSSDTAEGGEDTSAADTASPEDSGVTPDTAPGDDTGASDDVGGDAEIIDGAALTCDEPAGGAFWANSAPLFFPIDGQPIMRGYWEDDDLTEGREEIEFLIDTGAQVTCFDVDLTEGSVTPFSSEYLGLETTAVCGGIVKGCDLAEAEAYIGLDIQVLLGESTLRRLNTYIDYREQRAWFYKDLPDTPPPGMDGVTPFVMPYERQNELPVARVGLGNGVELPLLTDTGSGVSIITQTFFDRVEEAHGSSLPRLEGYKWATNYGTDASFVTRIPEFHLGEVVVRDEWVVVIPDDFHIKELLAQSDIVIEGFLGYPHYRHFLTEFRGPDSEFRFWPYPDDAHIPTDTWHKVGVDVTMREEGPRVEMIFSPSDAADSDIALGDTILSIDGEGVTTFTADAVRGLLHGTPGESRTLVLDREGETITVEVMVEDLLPE